MSEQIAGILAQAQQRVEQAMHGSAEQRAALIEKLEEVAQQAADDETAGHPYLALAEQLRDMAVQLRAVDAPKKRWWERRRGG